MKQELLQKRGFNYRKHTLMDDKILVETKSIRKIEKYEVKLDKLGFQTRYQAENTIFGNVFLVICIAIPIALGISQYNLHNMYVGTLIFNFLFWWFFALVIILNEHQDDIFLVGGEYNLVFYRTIPSEEKVLQFLNLIIETAKSKIKNKYLPLESTISDEDYLERLTWLKDTEVISEKEFDDYKMDFEIKRLL